MKEYSLSLGKFEHNNADYLYEGDESLITIARPGRGKSQALVVRNLLRLKGPAVVLDVKPELFRLTANWRSAAVGPIVRFEPSDLESSATFNPLDSIPRNPVLASKAIKDLVRLLIVPDSPKGGEGFWEGRAMQFIQGATLDVALHASEERRNMASVVNWLAPTKNEYTRTVDRLQACDVPALKRLGNELQRMPEDVRESLFSSAQRHIEIWGAPEIVPLTSTTNWSFDILRQEHGTLYLCVTPEELEAYAPIIRVILGQALQEYRRGAGGDQVTVFVDEFPQLGYMEGLIRLLELGRGAGCRLWLLAQSVGQIQQRYGEDITRSIMEMCHIRSFIEPTGDLAHYLERELGTTRNVYSGKQIPMATAQELAGPDYVGKVIVLEGGKLPARLRRIYAFEDPETVERINFPFFVPR
jgi:type IV secretion system protein VirD4